MYIWCERAECVWIIYSEACSCQGYQSVLCPQLLRETSSQAQKCCGHLKPLGVKSAALKELTRLSRSVMSLL